MATDVIPVQIKLFSSLLLVDSIANQLYVHIKKKGEAEEDVMGAAKEVDAAVAFPTNRKSQALMNRSWLNLQ